MSFIEQGRAGRTREFGLRRVFWEIGACSLLALLMISGCAEPRSDVERLDPAELADEVRSALAEPLRLERYTRLLTALRQLGPENIEAVREVYVDLHRSLGEPELAPFLDAWVAIDPAAAYTYVEDLPNAHATAQAHASVIYSWATRNPLAARDVVLEINPANLSLAESSMYALIQGWAISDPAGLLDYILTGTDDPGEMAHLAMPQLFLRSGAEGVFDWTDQFIERTTAYGPRMKAFRFAVRVVAFRDPQAAIVYVDKHHGADYAKDGPRAVVEVWIKDDHVAALEWLRTQAPAESRAEALRISIGGWLSADRAAARSWLDAAPVGDPYYQPAFDTLAKRLSKNRPEEAVEWCRRGQTEEVNSPCLQAVAKVWYRKDPVAAGHWLEHESGLDVEDRVVVRQRGRRRPE